MHHLSLYYYITRSFRVLCFMAFRTTISSDLQNILHCLHPPYSFKIRSIWHAINTIGGVVSSITVFSSKTFRSLQSSYLKNDVPRIFFSTKLFLGLWEYDAHHIQYYNLLKVGKVDFFFQSHPAAAFLVGGCALC